MNYITSFLSENVITISTFVIVIAAMFGNWNNKTTVVGGRMLKRDGFRISTVQKV